MVYIKVLSDNYSGLITSIAVKHKFPEYRVAFEGTLSPEHQAVQLFLSKNKVSELLGIDLLELFVLCDATICNAYSIEGCTEKKKYIASDKHGEGWGVLDFYQLLLMQDKTLDSLEDYSVLIAAAKSAKVLDPFKGKHSHFGGVNLNEAALTKVLLHKAREIDIEILLKPQELSLSSSVTQAIQYQEPDLVLDLRPLSGNSLAETDEFLNWKRYFNFFCAKTEFNSAERITDPVVKINISHHGWTKKIPLRSGTSNLLWQECSSCIDLPSYGRLSNCWNKKRLALGCAAINAGDYLFSELDLLFESLSIFMGVWNGLKPTEHLMAEYNRQIAWLYDSALAFHVLADKLMKAGKESVLDSDLPSLLKSDMLLFSACGRLQKLDKRFPSESLWIQAMAHLKIKPADHSPIECGISAEDLKDFYFQQLQNIQNQVAQLPSHLVFVNQLLNRLQEANFAKN